MKKKICTKCKKELPVSDFYKRSNGNTRSWCKECNKSCAVDFYKKNPEYNKKNAKKWRDENKEYYSNYRKERRFETYLTESSRKYKVNKEFLRTILKPMKCEICDCNLDFSSKNTHNKPNIDHCHTTGKVRGILCGYCNNLIGRAKDSIEILEKSIEYLRR